MSLQEYQKKRNFDETPEPAIAGVELSNDTQRKFVVQKHAARNLHFDLRLELDGVLKSWAIPLGPSLDPRVKRLAVEVEDHPLTYGSFEGVIPPKQYGAGRMIVWDRGIWMPIKEPSAALAAGDLKFVLSGERLKGSWALVRTRKRDGQQQWLLIKHKDQFANSTVDLIEAYTDSIISGKTLQTIGELPDFVEPKLPSLTEKTPEGDEWIHELKLDGYRMQAQWRHDGFRLMTRSGIDWTSRYSQIANGLAKLALNGTIIDGELVAIDAEGKSDFGSLQDAANQKTFAYFAFDLLFDRSRDVRSLPLLQRKSLLKAIIANADLPRLQYSDYIAAKPNALIEQCMSLGLEGIVSKRIDRPYSSGRASDWLKTKFRFRENLVIGGYEVASESKALSSLLVGYHDAANLKFAGRVGTGWSQASATKLIDTLAKIVTPTNPFREKIPAAKVARKTIVHFAAPHLVAEIEFGSWTKNKLLRHAAFKILSSDFEASQITDESLFADQRISTVVPERSKLETQRSTALLPGLSNQQRVLYPQDNVTKEDVAAYLFQVSQWLLPHIVDRPISLLRCTGTIDGEQYFQRHPGKGFPTQIEALKIASESKQLIRIANTDALLATAQIAAIELHPWGCRRDRMDRPDRIIIDLDPDINLAWLQVIEAAFIVKDELQRRNLQSFIKTTGGKGLHIVVPIARRYDWTKVFTYCKEFAKQLETLNSKLFVANMSKARRKDRIFIDCHRNKRSATAVAAYSLRARNGATVSTPITWEELPKIRPTHFNLRTVPNRLKTLQSDPWEGIMSLNQRLKI